MSSIKTGRNCKLTGDILPLLNMIVYSVCGIGIVMGILFRTRKPKDDDTSNTPKVRARLE
jgi:hypothetical protein